MSGVNPNHTDHHNMKEIWYAGTKTTAFAGFTLDQEALVIELERLRETNNSLQMEAYQVRAHQL
jgi:hypothetical protein